MNVSSYIIPPNRCIHIHCENENRCSLTWYVQSQYWILVMRCCVYMFWIQRVNTRSYVLFLCHIWRCKSCFNEGWKWKKINLFMWTLFKFDCDNWWSHQEHMLLFIVIFFFGRNTHSKRKYTIFLGEKRNR